VLLYQQIFLYDLLVENSKGEVMHFDEILTQVIAVLQRQGRVSYGALKRRFALDDAYLQDLKDELINAQQVARDEGGKVLVWRGDLIERGAKSEEHKKIEDQNSGVAARPTPTLHAPRTEREHRQLTVMFCGLSDPTGISLPLDPEELSTVVQEYHTTCAAVIERYEGCVVRYLSDGLLVYFGYPIAHEDDAQRAVRAGLEILKLSHSLDSLPNSAALYVQLRMGIHTGPVIVGEISDGNRWDLFALGETPKVAAQIHRIAEPGTLILSAMTYRLVTGYFTCQLLGVRDLKDRPEPIEIYQVIGESGARSRLEVAVASGLTPLVGREEEEKLLLKRWEQVKEGRGQVVLLSGEAGIGKSRLVRELTEQIAEERIFRIELRCSPYHQHSAFYPIIDFLQRALQFTDDDSPQEKLRKLEQALSRSHLEASLPFVASLLSLPVPRSSLADLTPQKQREKTIQLIVAWLLVLTERRPVLSVWEDLHWADPSTLDFLRLFIDQLTTSRTLAIITFRPEFTPPWGSRSHLTQLMLSRLGRIQVEAMVEKVTGGKELPTTVVQQIVTKTDGVPLFIEELTKMVLESGLLRENKGAYELIGPLPPLAIPTTLQDSLLARLDRLATAREVAQIGAVLGREFSYELLQLVSPVDEENLQHALMKLMAAEVLYRRGVAPQVQYTFKHALIRDVAYQSLLRSKRHYYHQRIAQILEERFAETKEAQPELLAHHYTEAGLNALAIPYWQLAGQRALARSAFVEAVDHLMKGIEALKTLPDTQECRLRELELQTVLGPTLMALKGYGAPEVERAYARALELCRQIGETPRLLQVLSGLEMFYLTRGEVRTARELGEQCLALARHAQNPGRLLQTHLVLGNTLFQLGEFTPAREHLAQGIMLYKQRKHGAPRALQDPGVDCLCYMALVLWCLGYPEQALQKSNEALALAERLARPLSLVVALSLAAELCQFRQEGQAVLERVSASIALANQHEFPLWSAYGAIYRGWALVEQGQGRDGIVQMQEGLAISRATGAEVVRPWLLSMLADAYRRLDEIEKGLAVITEAFTVMEEKGERMAEAELYRLKGELSLQSEVRSPRSEVTNPQPLNPNPQSEAEACFLKAIEIAQRQGTKSWELRTTVRLSRLWQRQGRRTEAHQILAEIYQWFTEGFGTRDLQAAKGLLVELNEMG